MNKDYRNTKYCKPLENVTEEKNKLDAEIRKEHPRATIIYEQVSSNSSGYKEPFMEIYNYKCGYCGNSNKNLDKRSFEIDHYICESSFDSNVEAGKMENLVLSCYDCNRSKHNLHINGDYINKLHPDFKEIKDVFYRDDNYYIKISEKFKDDDFIKTFYEKLKLGYQTRRLDFLLMNMRGLCDELEGHPQHVEMLKSYVLLQEKRNLTTLSK